MAGKRYNIGLVTGNVEDDFPNQICEGAIQAAAELDDNLFIMPVKYFDRYDFTDPLQKYEYQYNTLISYAQVHSLDIVLLCLGNISAIHETRSAEIINGFGDIPIILIASEQDGYSSVCYANEAGLTEGIEALVTRENREHIGIITGYTTNKDSYERLETYKRCCRRTIFLLMNPSSAAHTLTKNAGQMQPLSLTAIPIWMQLSAATTPLPPLYMICCRSAAS